MNLLAKICGGAMLILPLCMISCNNSDDFGLELNPGQSGVDVLYAEFDLPVTTYFIDSLRTDLGANILLGGHADETFGSITSTAYCELDFQTGKIPADSLRIINAILRLPITDRLSSTADFSFDVDVRVLIDTIFSSVVYLADDAIPTFDQVIDTWSVTVEESDTVITIPLGEQLRSAIWQASVEAEDVNNIQFGIEMSSSSTGGLAAFDIFSEAAELEFLTRDPVDTAFTSSYVLRNHFHNITQDRSQSSIAELVNTGDTLTEDNLSYMNLMAGVYSRIDLGPYLRFVESTERIIINKADIEVPIGEAPGNIMNDTVSQFYFYFFREGSIINGPGIVGDVQSTLLMDELSYANRGAQGTGRRIVLEEGAGVYDDAMTLFLQSLLQNHRDEEDYLTEALVTVPVVPLSLEHTAILKNGVKLKVFYTTTN